MPYAFYSILPAAIFSSIPPYCLEQTCSLEWNSIAARFQSKSSTQVRIQHGNHSYLKVRSLAGYQRSHHGHPLEYFETIRIFLSPIRSIISLARIIGILGRLDTHAPLYVKDTSTFIVIQILRHFENNRILLRKRHDFASKTIRFCFENGMMLLRK